MPTPAGTVTFLFTDVEGSTRLWELHPEPMKPALARHDALLQQAIVANHGHVVKTTGDGCHAAFGTALDAVTAALHAQRALNAEPWPEIRPNALRVRMGVHTGEAEPRAGDYYGKALNRAARLMAAGHGGQVLVSAATAELVRDDLPGDATLLDLGEHRLKDLIRPEHIFQLAHPALPAGFPPLRSLDVFPNNLPIQITSFVGREHEMDEVERVLASSRIVTLTGSGGTGKTRLTLQVAADVLPAYPDGVWLVELAPLSDPDAVLQALAGVLELRSAPGIPLLELVTGYLRGKRLLLVLDNCEHLITACAELAEHLLRTCPAIKILASSREALGIAGEVSYPVPSLSLPPAGDAAPEELLRSEAAQLFVERATAVNPGFAAGEDKAAAIDQICRRLDGIPLALELAAARAKLFPVEQIAMRLNDRFRLLTGGSRTAVPRQQTLRAMIDWSYDLLTPPERALLRRLAVFSMSWSFEAAEAVCSDLDVLSLLEQLVNKSLVVAEEHRGQARYHMLETIRQYAREKLLEAGEGIEARDRHLDYYLRLSEGAEPELRGRGAFEWIERLAPDADNLAAAIEWGEEGRPEDALTLFGNLLLLWAFVAIDRERSLRRVHELLGRLGWQPGVVPAPPRRLRAVARGLSSAGLLLMGQGDYPGAIDTLVEAIPLEREVGDTFYLPFALAIMSSLEAMIGDATGAAAAAEESQALLRGLAERRWLVIPLPILAAIEVRLGHEQRADELRREVRQYVDQLDHPMFVPALLGLGMDAQARGEVDEARAYYRQGLALAQRLKARHFIAAHESELAHLARRAGDLEHARDAYRRLIRTWKDLGQIPAVAHQLECFAMIAAEERAEERAARLFGAAEAIRERIHVPRRGPEQKEFAKAVAALRERMDARAFAAAWAEGRAMEMEQAIRLAAAATEEARPVPEG